MKTLSSLVPALILTISASAVQAQTVDARCADALNKAICSAGLEGGPGAADASVPNAIPDSAPLPPTGTAPLPSTSSAPLPTASAPIVGTETAPAVGLDDAPVPATDAAPLPSADSAPMPALDSAPLPIAAPVTQPPMDAAPMPPVDAPSMPPPTPDNPVGEQLLPAVEAYERASIEARSGDAAALQRAAVAGSRILAICSAAGYPSVGDCLEANGLALETPVP